MRLTLEAWRRARGLSQAKVAEVIGVHVNTYKRWEKNPGEMRCDKAISLSNLLGIRLDDIFLPENTTENSKNT